MEFEPLPQGLVCAGCGYELSGLTARTCPECGRTVVPSDLSTHARRISADVGFARRIRHHLLAWLAVIGLTGAAAFEVSRSIKDAAIATGVAVALVAISTGIGAASARTGRTGDRRPYFLAWIIAQWWLHTPWLVVAPGIMSIVILDGLDRRLNPPRGDALAAVAATVGVVLWCVLLVVGLAVWAVRFGECSRRFGGSGERQVVLATLGALLILLLAAAFGVVCGAEGMGWARRMAPGMGQWP